MNLVEKAVNNGGKLAPLIIPSELTSGTGLTNPSVFVDDDGSILVNLRHVNYTLYHSENTQQFPSRWGPLSYLHPENDVKLRTINYICELDSNLSIIGYGMIDTSKLDTPPQWEFTGEEDCRLVKWDNKYYAIGVRRDTESTGKGRMELSEITIDKETWKVQEVSRLRIPVPGDNETYCEKNWMPILDKPYHFIKWTCPTEVVRTYPDFPARCEQVILKDTIQPPKDQRGSSQVIKWNNYYIAITHEVDLFKNYLLQKDGIYRHRLVIWDEDFNLIGLSPEAFSFLDARIEFVAGIAKYNDDLLISFGFQDNTAFILKTPNVIVENMIMEALKYEN